MNSREIQKRAGVALAAKERMDKGRESYLGLCGDYMRAYRSLQDAIRDAGLDAIGDADVELSDVLMRTPTIAGIPDDLIANRIMIMSVPNDETGDDREGVAG